MKQLLIIEDEVKIARFLQLELEHEGYSVDLSHNGREGLNKALEGNFDLVILDVMLPSLNGMEVLRRIRQTSDLPVIMLTAKDDVMDKVMGLDLGAQDYITKPFAIEELLARIRVLFKLKVPAIAPSQIQETLTCSKLSLCPEKYEVSYDNTPIALTKKEFELLEYLMRNKNLVVTRESILEKVWGYDYLGDTNVVDVYIRYLRNKIDQKFQDKLIYTIRGMGYQIKDATNN
ncbi:response regulator transcription factor [Cellulosilyticum ruminicola]|uniref:response regulator transcription factor n=1 Tax=Cellulosilyticum ruminicola TaxID=425254 RepID=UPI0006D20397|nr:response regulator transcription factor [Cellulosilyticum ruminicola]